MPSHVPQLPSQQSVFEVHAAPSGWPDTPPHVWSHVPHDAPLQQLLSDVHVSPVMPVGPPQVPSHPHVAPPQQSLLVVHAPPCP